MSAVPIGSFVTRKTFLFLLHREVIAAILSRFDVAAISRYSSELEQDLPHWPTRTWDA